MTITEDIKYVGVNDHDIDLFEGQHQVENGMAKSLNQVHLNVIFSFQLKMLQLMKMLY